MIQPVIEGHGEDQAFPTLLRRLIPELGAYVEVLRPLRCPKNQMTASEADFKRMLHLARLDSRTTAVLFLFDSDDDCAQKHVPQMHQWAHETYADLPCGIVMARREYEGWFLAALDSLGGIRGIPEGAHFGEDPEKKRDAKGELRRLCGYHPTTHQAAFSQTFDFRLAYRRASSFRKLTRELARLLTELGYEPQLPAGWEY